MINKKDKVLIIILLTVMIMFELVQFFINTKIIDGVGVINKRILIEKASLDNAWGFSYGGTIVCTDGSIYKFYTDERYENNYLNIRALLDREKYILKNVTEYKGKIGYIDLIKIKMNLIRGVNPLNTTSKYVGVYDLGEVYIRARGYMGIGFVELINSGTFYTVNNSKSAQRILEILEKYDIGVGNPFDGWPFN